MLAAAPAAGAIVPATGLVQTLGKQQCCGYVNIFLPDPALQSRNHDLPYGTDPDTGDQLITDHAEFGSCLIMIKY